MTELLRANNVSLGYDGQAVVHNLDLTINAGEIVAVFGPNGAGKTTTLLSLTGELAPLSGSVQLFGEITEAPLYQRVRQGLSFISDERSLIFGLSVQDNLRMRGGSVDAALTLFPELKPHLGRATALLSGGQQQMVTMARCLASNPKILIADELSMGLAPQIVDRLLLALRQAADAGLGVLLVEQHVSQALQIADRGIILNQGRVVLSGSAAELKTKMAELESAYLFGDSSSESATLINRRN
ncbi:MAG: ATP-binding cassette domain-containing protein [Spongiibacteraceae bacterium]